MNRNLNGEIITTEELWAIADLDEVGVEAVKAIHNTNLIYGKLLDITARRRFEMFMHGELILDTRKEVDK